MKPPKAGVDDFAAAGISKSDLTDLSRAALGHTLERYGDDIVVTWPELTVVCSLSGVRESGHGIQAEVSLTHQDEEVHWGQLSLASTSAREQLLKKLGAITPKVPWRRIIETTCRDTARAVREGSPLLEAVPAPRPPGERNLIEGLTIPLDATTLLYGDGDVGKSWLLGLALVATTTGRALPHLRPTQAGRAAAFLDWENGQADFEDMLYSLERALGLRLPPGSVFYRQMSRSLVDELPRLRSEFARRAIQDIYLDSLAPASGMDPESANAAVGCLTALRAFPGTTRVLSGHVSKNAADQSGGAMRPFGSVFVRNLVRSAWEIRRDEDAPATELVFAAYHRKHNRGARGVPLSLRLSFEDQHLTAISSHDLAEAPTLLTRASLSQQLRAALAHGAKTIPALALEVGAKEGTIDKTLRRHKAVFVQLPGDKPPYLWGLAQR